MQKIYKEGDPALAPEYKARNVKDGKWAPMYPAGAHGQRVIGRAEGDKEDDDVHEVSEPDLPFEKWIDSTGGQSRLVFGQNSDPRRVNFAHREQLRRSRANADWVPYDFNTALQYRPDLAQGCTLDKWPEKLLEISQKMKRRHSKREDARNAKADGHVEKLVRELDRKNDAEKRALRK